MRPIHSVFLSAVLLAGCGPAEDGRTFGRAVADAGPASPADGPTEHEAALAQEVLQLVNQERTSRGLQAVAWDATTVPVAYAHSQDMVRRGYFAHENPEGLSPFDRLDAAGVQYTAAGENIAKGFTTPQEVMAAWMSSAGHRSNILSADFTLMGVGVVEGGADGPHWTQLFRRP